MIYGVNVFDLQFNFEGQYDLVKFIKLIQEHKMYATLRVGPFIQAEWNHGYNSEFLSFFFFFNFPPV